MSASPFTDESLWLCLRQGSESAFSALFERYYSRLVSYGKSLTSSQERAQDCVQDVFANLWLYRHTLNDVASVKAYLLSSVRKRVARLHERDHIFRQTTPIDEVDFSVVFTIEDELIHDEETAAKVYQLNRLINGLPPRQKEALVLRYYHRLTVEQIAELMSVNYQSVVNLLYRAVQHLRHEWLGELPLLLFLITSALQ